MAVAAISSLSLGHTRSHLCYAEGFCCSNSCEINGSWIKPCSDRHGASDNSCVSFRCRNPFFGSPQPHQLFVGHDICPSKVSVAADYSDSVPDSSNYVSNRGYHPLEEVKFSKRIRETKLTPAEIARTTVEVNSSSLLVFPATVHCEPHEEISWAEFQYVVDDYGDIVFEIFDDKNILQDRGASNLVNALIGIDIPFYENRRMGGGYNFSGIDLNNDIPFGDEYFEVMNSEESDIALPWGIPDTSSWVHPIFFAKCLTKAVYEEYDRKMDHPSNGVSIVGCLRPVFDDEESYLKRLFHSEYSYGCDSDWKGGEIWSSDSTGDERKTASTLYRLESMRIELFSVYGVQADIDVQDYQDAEPDALAHSTLEIIERFSEKGIKCDVALKALCKKKGLHVERASLIGVDSLGMDVRVFSGVEVRTHRFPFKVRATSEVAAEKQIQQLLFPRSLRKKIGNKVDRFRDPDAF